MKKSFITGLVILLPLALTLWIVAILVSWLTNPFSGQVQSVLAKWGLLEKGFLFIPGNTLQLILSKALVIAVLLVFTLLLGFIGRRYFVDFLLKSLDTLIHKIPLVSTVYKTSQDVVHTTLKQDSGSFKQVVIVPFPSPRSFSIGLVTQEKLENIPGMEGKIMVGVFIPTTPNPTSGYILLYEKSEVAYIDMKVEDALKYIISCGALMNEPFRPLGKDSMQENLL